MDPIKDKIKKLITLSKDRGATEAEAETAMSKALELMAEYQLGMAEINSHNIGDKANCDNIEEVKFKNRYTFSKWQCTIWSATAKLYGCDSFYQIEKAKPGTMNCTVLVIGDPNACEVVKQMAVYFIDICYSLSEEYTKEGQDKGFIQNFRKGFAARLAANVADKLERMKYEHSRGTGTAIALIDQRNRVEQHVSQKYPNLQEKTLGGEGFGYILGSMAASGVDLNQPLQSHAAGSPN